MTNDVRGDRGEDTGPRMTRVRGRWVPCTILPNGTRVISAIYFLDPTPSNPTPSPELGDDTLPKSCYARPVT